MSALEVGKQADFVLWDIDHPAELAYRFGANPCLQVMKRGQRFTPRVEPTGKLFHGEPA